MGTQKRSELLAELRRCNDAIDAAYWTFTRCARGKPPILVVPEAYRRRAEILKELRTIVVDVKPRVL